MKRRRRTPSPIPGLSAAQTEFLQTGCCPNDPFVEFDCDIDGWRQLWRQHRAKLLADWNQRGEGKAWGARFDDDEDRHD